MIVTIDGPAGSGKSTAARKLAERLGLPYLDTGAMYRAVTLAALEANIDPKDEWAVAQLAEGAELDVDGRPDGPRVTLDGRDVTEAIRTARVSDNASRIATAVGVREVLVKKQRQIGRRLGSLVTEGRDQGSVVFPDADVKFFLSASPQTRARRRLAELGETDPEATYESVLESLRKRDRRDSERSVAPLVRPNGAIEIDTSEVTIAEMADRLYREVMRARAADAPS